MAEGYTDMWGSIIANRRVMHTCSYVDIITLHAVYMIKFK